MFCISHFISANQKLGFYICFFNCQSCKCGQLSHNHITRDLGDPNFSCTTVIIPIVICRITFVHLKNLPVHISIHLYSYSYLQKVIGRFLNRLLDKLVKLFLELSEVIWTNMSLRSGSNSSSFV